MPGARIMLMSGRLADCSVSLREQIEKRTSMNKLIAFLYSPSGLSKREVPSTENPHHEGDDSRTPGDLTDAELDELTEFERLYVPTIQPRVRFANRQVQPGGLEDFVWETDKDGMKKPAKMATPHLFYTLRMLFNHLVPPLARVGEFKRRKHVDEWPIGYRCQASAAMRVELAKRKDMEIWMPGEMKDMDENATFLDFVFNGAQNVELPGILSHEQLDMLTGSNRRDGGEQRGKIKAMLDGQPPYEPAELERVGWSPLRKTIRRGKPVKKKSAKKNYVNGYLQMRNGEQVWINGYKR